MFLPQIIYKYVKGHTTDHLDLIATLHIQVLKHHIAPHKYVELILANLKQHAKKSTIITMLQCCVVLLEP